MTIMASKIEEHGDDQSDSLSDKESVNDKDSERETDSEREPDSDENDDQAESTNKNNTGWVDSISKILKTSKPKGKRSLVLSKAKKLTDVKEKPKPAGFQVESRDGTIKEEQLNPLEKLVKELNDEEYEPTKKKRREIADIRVKPNILDKGREKTLSKISTKGVVQLFNAVTTQQKDIDKKLKEAGPLEAKRDKVMKNIDKRTFLDVLMGEKSENVEEKVKNRENDTKSEPTWNVLRDDFMMGAKLKDWDKELESEVEHENLEME